MHVTKNISSIFQVQQGVHRNLVMYCIYLKIPHSEAQQLLQSTSGDIVTGLHTAMLVWILLAHARQSSGCSRNLIARNNCFFSPTHPTISERSRICLLGRFVSSIRPLAARPAMSEEWAGHYAHSKHRPLSASKPACYSIEGVPVLTNGHCPNFNQQIA